METGVSQEAILYVTSRVTAMLGEGAKVLLVFDGDRGYEAKADTQASRRNARAEVLAKPTAQRSAMDWKTAAAPQEPFLQAIMAWCVANSVPFMVAPYEADQQLVELQQAGWIDSILVASNDSDLTTYGGTDCIYEYDPVRRTCVWVRLFVDVLVSNPRPEAVSFKGWVYDRFIVLCLLSGHDYLPNIPNCGLKTVKKLMDATPLPPVLQLLGDTAHPPIMSRPEVWRCDDAIRMFAGHVLASKLPLPVTGSPTCRNSCVLTTPYATTPSSASLILALCWNAQP